jgi:hypothetical protein
MSVERDKVGILCATSVFACLYGEQRIIQHKVSLRDLTSSSQNEFSLRLLCVLWVSVVKDSAQLNRRDAENAEEAQRVPKNHGDLELVLKSELRILPQRSSIVHFIPRPENPN